MKISDVWILEALRIMVLACEEGREEILEKGWEVAMHIKDYDLWLKEGLKPADKCDWLR